MRGDTGKERLNAKLRLISCTRKVQTLHMLNVKANRDTAEQTSETHAISGVSNQKRGYNLPLHFLLLYRSRTDNFLICEMEITAILALG